MKYIYDVMQEILNEEGLYWQEFIDEFLPGRMAETIRDTHHEVNPDWGTDCLTGVFLNFNYIAQVSRPDLRLNAYLLAIIEHARGLTPTELKRKLTLSFSKKIETKPGQLVPVLAIRISGWRSFGGFSIEDLKKV